MTVLDVDLDRVRDGEDEDEQSQNDLTQEPAEREAKTAQPQTPQTTRNPKPAAIVQHPKSRKTKHPLQRRKEGRG